MATKVIRGRSVFLTRERVLSLRLCATARPAESSIHAPALDRLECSVCFLAVPWTQAHVMSQGGPVSCWLCCCRERVAGESRRPTEGLPCVAVLREALATCLWGELGFLAQGSMSGSQGLPLAQAGLPLCLSCWGGFLRDAHQILCPLDFLSKKPFGISSRLSRAQDTRVGSRGLLPGRGSASGKWVKIRQRRCKNIRSLLSGGGGGGWHSQLESCISA